MSWNTALGRAPSELCTEIRGGGGRGCSHDCNKFTIHNKTKWKIRYELQLKNDSLAALGLKKIINFSSKLYI